MHLSVGHQAYIRFENEGTYYGQVMFSGMSNPTSSRRHPDRVHEFCVQLVISNKEPNDCLDDYTLGELSHQLIFRMINDHTRLFN